MKSSDGGLVGDSRVRSQYQWTCTLCLLCGTSWYRERAFAFPLRQPRCTRRHAPAARPIFHLQTHRKVKPTHTLNFISAYAWNRNFSGKLLTENTPPAREMFTTIRVHAFVLTTFEPERAHFAA